FAADKIPHEPRQPRPLVLQLQPRTRRKDRGFDLPAMADDALVGQQALDLALGVARHLRGIEAVEGAAEILALAQDRDPRQARLEAFEHEHLEERAVIVLRDAP